MGWFFEYLLFNIWLGSFLTILIIYLCEIKRENIHVVFMFYILIMLSPFQIISPAGDNRLQLVHLLSHFLQTFPVESQFKFKIANGSKIEDSWKEQEY